MERLRRFLMSMTLIFASTLLYAQTEITGSVEDDMGPIIGATVMEKGTSNGTVTDFDGNFKLKVKAGTTLVFSYIGYFCIRTRLFLRRVEIRRSGEIQREKT